ncbi:serine hydrolase domain-containing protein [Nonomuraea sp. NPDC050783]|uniref:serine hydrolase domain-containing protein n=1 Tax=Nonomuraea sp. NPDC050783 TaxID=3154634 RepID=UPI0034674FEF
MRIRLVAWASVAVLGVGAGTVTAVPASGGTAGRAVVGTAGGTAGATDAVTGVDPARLKSAMDEVHRAGMPGVFAEVRSGGRVWRGASGVADLRTGRPVTPGMLQRVGSLAKTFVAAAVLQQVEKGRVELDAPIGRYLPRLVPGERGRRITVRMLLNHTSGISEYLGSAFPSLQKFPSLPDMSPKSLDDNRFRRFTPAELIEMGLKAPAVGRPGASPGVYANTNYLILGELLEKVTGTAAETYITRNVIERAGLRHTAFPAGARLKGPHPRMYEAFFGLVDPPRDYSVYDMSWTGIGASLVSTVEDLNRFYAKLLDGTIVKPSSLARMRRTGPVISQSGQRISYGLGLHVLRIPGCGTFWGHDGTVWGAQTESWIRADGRRQVSVAMNLARWNRIGPSGEPQRHPIDEALSAFKRQALCGGGAGAPAGNAS